MTMNEPSVLDYVKAKLKFWEKSDLHFPKPEEVKIAIESHVETIPAGLESRITTPALKFDFKQIRIPWRSLIAIAVAFIAQGLLEPPKPSNEAALALYAAAICYADLECHFPGMDHCRKFGYIRRSLAKF